MFVNKSPATAAVVIALVAAAVLIGLLAPALASEEHEGGKLEYVVPLEGKTGVNLLMAKWYNENRVLYALAVTITMAAFGFVIGRATERLLQLIGLK